MENAPIDRILLPKPPKCFTLYDTARGIDEKEKGELDALIGIKTTRVGRPKDSNWGAGTARAKTTAVADLRVVRQAIS